MHHFLDLDWQRNQTLIVGKKFEFSRYIHVRDEKTKILNIMITFLLFPQGVSFAFDRTFSLSNFSPQIDKISTDITQRLYNIE